MNRILSIILSFSLLLSCIGCAQQTTSNQTTEDGLSAQPQLPTTSAADLPDQEAGPETLVQSGEPDAPEEPEEAQQPEEPYVRAIDPSGPMVALTFDDGPHATYSHAILDILEMHHGVATFFEVARNIPQSPDALVRMLELGCEIGSHSNVHQDLSLLSQKAMLQDLQSADEAFIAATGKAPTLLRPPYGAVNKAVKYGSGRSVITWNVDTQDWLSLNAQTIVSYIQSLEDLDGQILLMHSTYESTVEAVKVLVPWLMEQGYQLVTVTELMAYYYGELPQPNQFYGYTYFTTHGRTDAPVELPDSSEPAPPVEIPVINDPRPVAPSVPSQPETPPVQPPSQDPTPQEPTPEEPAPEEPIPEEPAPPTDEEPTEPGSPEETPPADAGSGDTSPDTPGEDIPPAGPVPGSGGENTPPADDPSEGSEGTLPAP